MKKILSMLLAALMLASISVSAFAEGNTQEEFKNNGYTLSFPSEFDEENMKGVFYPYPYGEIDDGVFFASFFYFAMPQDEFNALMEKDSDEWTDVEEELFLMRQGMLAAVFSIDGERMASDLAEIIVSESDQYYTEIA